MVCAAPFSRPQTGHSILPTTPMSWGRGVSVSRVKERMLGRLEKLTPGTQGGQHWP